MRQTDDFTNGIGFQATIRGNWRGANNYSIDRDRKQGDVRDTHLNGMNRGVPLARIAQNQLRWQKSVEPIRLPCRADFGDATGAGQFVVSSNPLKAAAMEKQIAIQFPVGIEVGVPDLNGRCYEGRGIRARSAQCALKAADGSEMIYLKICLGASYRKLYHVRGRKQDGNPYDGRPTVRHRDWPSELNILKDWRLPAFCYGHSRLSHGL